jgi:3-oxoacyl-[acyl-carrier protein] reductase
VNVGCLATPADAQPEGTAFAAARGAIASLTRALARECASHGVTVNALAPAAIATSSFEALNEAQRRQVLARVPMGRACEPHEFAHAVRFLVAPDAGFVTGQLIAIDGGWHLQERGARRTRRAAPTPESDASNGRVGAWTP